MLQARFFCCLQVAVADLRGVQINCAGFHMGFRTLACKSLHISTFELICIGDPTLLSYLKGGKGGANAPSFDG